MRKNPSITTALIALNVAVFAAMLLARISPVAPATAQLVKWGANWGPLSLGPQAWRLLTSNYVHAGILHIGFNMWCLWNLGFLAERVFGPWTFLLIYTACGLAGSLSSLWWHPLTVGVGASGAIFGVAGALIAALHLGNLPIPKEALRGTLKSLLAFAGYNLFFGAVSKRIDNSAHIGGLLCGLALGALLAKHLMAEPEIRNRWRGTALVATGAILFVVFGMVQRVNGYVVPLQQGMESLQKNQFDAAERSLEEAVAKKPDNHDSLFLLATVYYQKQEYAKAEATLQHLLRLDPEDADARMNLGLVQTRLGKYDDAIATLNTALQMNPKDADAQQALGEAYAAKNMVNEARAAFQKASELRGASKP